MTLYAGGMLPATSIPVATITLYAGGMLPATSIPVATMAATEASRPPWRRSRPHAGVIITAYHRRLCGLYMYLAG